MVTDIQELTSAWIQNLLHIGILGDYFFPDCDEINTLLNLFFFSWDELGKYDIPAVIDYILLKTGQSKLSYVGHSLGCGMFFITMVTRPEYNSKIEMMV